MKILLTGATGFIGRHLLEVLKSNYEVYCIVRKTSKLDYEKKFVYDGNLDRLAAFFQKQNFDGIIHLASLFLSQHKPKDIDNLINSNISFGTHLLEISVQSNVKWFMNTGTFWQHYNNEEYNPVNLYAATKQAFEVIARYYVEVSNLVFTTIKLNDTFGANDTRTKIFKLWLDNLYNEEPLEMSEGKQIMDISYIDDVINAYLVMIKNLEKNPYKYNLKSYVVSNKEKYTLKELAKLFEKVAGKKLNIILGKKNYRKREVMLPFSRGEVVPGWEQKYSLEEAIKKYLKEEGWIN